MGTRLFSECGAWRFGSFRRKFDEVSFPSRKFGHQVMALFGRQRAVHQQQKLHVFFFLLPFGLLVIGGRVRLTLREPVKNQGLDGLRRLFLLHSPQQFLPVFLLGLAPRKLHVAVLLMKRTEQLQLLIGVAAQPRFQQLFCARLSIGEILLFGGVQFFKPLGFGFRHFPGRVFKLVRSALQKKRGSQRGKLRPKTRHRLIALDAQPGKILLCHAIREASA